MTQLTSQVNNTDEGHKLTYDGVNVVALPVVDHGGHFALVVAGEEHSSRPPETEIDLGINHVHVNVT